MRSTATDFVYKLPGASTSSRPGAHRSNSRGAGMRFASHARLFDQPDPRRLDLRASISSVPQQWLVRANHQRSSITVNVIIDVSASMFFGAKKSKLTVAAEFLDALGYSAHRYGDSVSLLAFDHSIRDDLYMPARGGRGIGLQMAASLNACKERREQSAGLNGLAQCVERIAANAGLIFLLSDFHWPMDNLMSILDPLGGALVVPLVVWDLAEIEPPAEGHHLSVHDIGSGHGKHLWLHARTRQQWRENVAARRSEIETVLGLGNIQPLYVEGEFNAEDLSRYFMERVH